MRSVRRYVLGLCGGIALHACGDGPFGPSETVELAHARARWAAAGLNDYRVDIRAACFCTEARLTFTRLELRGGAVVTGTPLGKPLGGEVPLSAWPTVVDVFATIGTASGGDYRDIEVRYDEVLGYPKRVSLRCETNVLDCGLTYELENLHPT